jgi:hypothetical protein
MTKSQNAGAPSNPQPAPINSPLKAAFDQQLIETRQAARLDFIEAAMTDLAVAWIANTPQFAALSEDRRQILNSKVADPRQDYTAQKRKADVDEFTRKTVAAMFVSDACSAFEATGSVSIALEATDHLFANIPLRSVDRDRCVRAAAAYLHDAGAFPGRSLEAAIGECVQRWAPHAGSVFH